MGCCKGDNNDPENPEELETCCKIQGPRCMCLPYDDAWVIASMVMSMIAVCISWIWWVTWLISMVGMVLFQLFWCCRQPKSMPYLSVAVAVVTSLISLGSGIYVLIAFRNTRYCDPFAFYSYGELNETRYIENTDDYFKENTDDYFIRDRCQEVTWAIIAFLCAALWAIVAGCMIYFVHSGRHAKWEKARSEPAENATATANPNAIVLEMGSAPEPSATASAPTIAMAMVVPAPENHKLDSTN